MLACVPAMGLAQSAAECTKNRDVGPQALDEASWNQLNAAAELVGKEKYNEAFTELTRMLGRSGGDRYLQAVLEQALAQVE
ncbi:MAG: hypothetical protein ACREO9_06785, partial [Lysobacterales bacterium]